MATVTLTLPDRTMAQAQQAAAALQRLVEEVLRDMLAAVLPTVHDAPAELQAELLRMTWLDTPELWRIARGQMSTEMQEQLQQLSHLQGQRPLPWKSRHNWTSCARAASAWGSQKVMAIPGSRARQTS